MNHRLVESIKDIPCENIKEISCQMPNWEEKLLSLAQERKCIKASIYPGGITDRIESELRGRGYMVFIPKEYNWLRIYVPTPQ